MDADSAKASAGLPGIAANCWRATPAGRNHQENYLPRFRYAVGLDPGIPSQADCCHSFRETGWLCSGRCRSIDAGASSVWSRSGAASGVWEDVEVGRRATADAVS